MINNVFHLMCFSTPMQNLLVYVIVPNLHYFRINVSKIIYLYASDIVNNVWYGCHLLG